MRICSFLPSATEIVYALGLGDSLYGVTYECDYPPDARKKPVVVRSVFESSKYDSAGVDRIVSDHAASGQPLYMVDTDVLKEAQPDLVLTQELCQVCAIPTRQVSDALAQLPKQPQVLSLDPKGLQDVLGDIIRVGEATGTQEQAQRLTSELRERIDAVSRRAALARRKPRVLCLEWLEPLMCGGHWIPEMVELAGGESIIGEKAQPSFQVQWEQVVQAPPEVIIAMPCGFDVRRGLQEFHWLTQREGWEKLPAVRNERVYVTDASSYYSRSGPRLVDGVEAMAEMFHPELFSGLVPEAAAIRLRGQLFRVG